MSIAARCELRRYLLYARGPGQLPAHGNAASDLLATSRALACSSWADFTNKSASKAADLITDGNADLGENQFARNAAIMPAI